MSETDTIHWEIRQLVKTKLFPDGQAVLRSALRALFQSRPEIRVQMVIRLPRSAAEAGKKVKKTKSGLPVSGRKTKKATGRR